MISVVLDTNVLVSANLNPEGLEALVVSLALHQQVRLCVSQAVFQEYERVLHYPRLKFLPPEVSRFMAHVRNAGAMFAPDHVVKAAVHEPDNRFLECAEAARADYLVTGNLRHFPSRWKSTSVVNARTFLQVWGETQTLPQ